MNTKIDFDKNYNRLTILKELPQRKYYLSNGKLKVHRYVLCQCDCGKRIAVRLYSVTSGHTKSCGCFAGIKAKAFHTTHGKSRSVEYMLRKNIIQRCYKENYRYYYNYGGRGIRVCRRWRESFENFYADMGSRPTPQHTLERINNNGNYTPTNCRWATKREQENNKRTNHYLKCDGIRLTMAEWARKINMPYNTIASRKRYGWSDERIIKCPVNHR